jgi:hypothetical protein
MEPNPRVPSRLGCGGLLLLAHGLPWIGLFAVGVIGGMDMTEAELRMGEERYVIWPVIWAVAPLAVVSLLAVYRLMIGHRDWLATAAALGWVVVGIWYGVTTNQFTWFGLALLTLILVATGTARDRRLLEQEVGVDGTGDTALPGGRGGP